MKTQEEIKELAGQLYPINNMSVMDGFEDMNRFERVAYEKGYTQCQEDILKDQKVTRFEVIDEKGRVYSQWNCKIELSYQDDGETLKVFIKLKQD